MVVLVRAPERLRRRTSRMSQFRNVRDLDGYRIELIDKSGK
jgi:hypothetical protein